jgi:integrase
MDIAKLLQNNRKPRQQKGEIVETSTAFLGRYYYTAEDGTRKQKAVILARKSDLYRSRSDVQPLMGRLMAGINSDSVVLNGRAILSEYIDGHYLPWVRENKAAATADGYRKIWTRNLAPHIDKVALVDLTTTQVTGVLTQLAQHGLGARSLSHTKWFLSGVYEHAVATGIVPANPVPKAKYLCRVERVKPSAVYSLESVLRMISLLEATNLQAAVAIGLAYFAALRPCEIRGLQWSDWTGGELTIRQSIWRGITGRTKTPESEASVPVIEPLRSLLEKLRSQSAGGYILQNSVGKPLSLDSLSGRVIAPLLKAAGIDWAGYYPCRRGISSLVTDTSKNPLNSTGLLRHSTPLTALKHYTRAQKDSIAAALKTVEEMATKSAEETTQ